MRGPFYVQVPLGIGALLFVVMCLMGCGGFTGGDPTIFGISPDRAQVARNESLVFLPGSNAPITSVQWRLREGAAAGTLVPGQNQLGLFATYTAPDHAGTFHIEATISVHPNETGRATATVTVL